MTAAVLLTLLIGTLLTFDGVRSFNLKHNSCQKQGLKIFRKALASPRILVLQAEINAEQGGVFRRKNLPVFGVAVGLTALFFQVFILYPWHELLRDDFSTLEVVTEGEVVEDKMLEEKLDKLIKIDLEILKKLDSL